MTYILMFVILIAMVSLICTILLTIAKIVSKKNLSDMEKLSPFECGFSPLGSSRPVFSLQFFLVTLIFLIFDVELVLLYPYLLVSGCPQLLPVMLLLGLVGVLSLGLLCEWSQAMLEWGR